MKIAFTTAGQSLQAPLEGRFGRAPRFLIYDEERGSVEILENQSSVEAAKGAGIQAAQAVVRAGAGAVVTGHCGPNAFRVLDAAGIPIYLTDAVTVSDALDSFRAGSLQRAASGDVDGHRS